MIGNEFTLGGEWLKEGPEGQGPDPEGMADP